MGNLFLNFMNEYWTPEEVKWYTEIMDLINAVQEDYADNIDLIIYSQTDEVSINEVSDLLKKAVQDILIALLENIGVTVAGDYPLDTILLYRIYKDMIEIENNEQIDFALSILESDLDDVTVFYELLTIVGTLEVDESEFTQQIAKISPFTRSKLTQYFYSRKETQVAVEETFDKIKASNRIKQFIEVLNDSEFLAINLIRNGVEMGLSFKSYLNLYNEEIFNLDIKDICYNLYLFAIISQDGCDSPVATIEKHIQNYLFEMAEVDSVLRGVGQIQMKLGTY